MRIISKFHDYYDGIQAHGQDDRVVFQRVEEKIPFFCEEHKLSSKIIKVSTPNDIFRYRFKNGKELNRKFYLLGFCGKIFPFIEMNYEERREGETKKKVTNFVFSSKEYEDFLTEIPDKKTREMYIDRFDQGDVKRKRYKLRGRYINNDSRKIINSFFEFSNTEDVDIFYKFKVPIFLIHIYDRRSSSKFNYNKEFDYIILNPNLEQFGFQRIKDPYTVFQEIEMFISGVLGIGEPNTVEVSNENRITKHGFDDYSFRKRPKNSS